MQRISLSAVMTAIASGNYIGYCLACGAEHDGIEPDACEYPCSECEEEAVYGAEEILLMGEAIEDH